MKYVALNKVAKIDRTVASDEECKALPYVGLEHIEKDAGHFAAEFERKPETTLLATKFRFTPNHVLYGKLRPYLSKVALPVFDGVCTTEILPILPVEGKLDRAYLWAFLLTSGFVEWASSNVSGANLPRLSPKLLAQYEIPLPPLPEQQRIAEVLSKADRLRRLRRTARELSDTYLQSVFLEMFGDPVSNPLGWEVRTLSALKTKLSYGTSAKCYSETIGLPVFRIPNVVSREIDLDDLKYTELPAKEVTKLTLHKGDILFVRTNGNPNYVGRCAVFDLDAQFLFASYLIRARLNLHEINPWFLATYLRLPAGRQAMSPYIRTTAGQSNIGMGGLWQIPIPLPPLPRQQQFAHIVHKFERLRVQQREAERQSEHLFQALLHRAFRGEV